MLNMYPPYLQSIIKYKHCMRDRAQISKAQIPVKLLVVTSMAFSLEQLITAQQLLCQLKSVWFGLLEHAESSWICPTALVWTTGPGLARAPCPHCIPHLQYSHTLSTVHSQAPAHTPCPQFVPWIWPTHPVHSLSVPCLRPTHSVHTPCSCS